MKYLILAVALAVAGCCTAPQPVATPKPAIQEKQSIDIDRQLLVDCPTVKKLPEGQSQTKEQVLQFNAELIVALSTCWHRQHDLAAVSASAFNITIPATTTNIVNKQ